MFKEGASRGSSLKIKYVPCLRGLQNGARKDMMNLPAGADAWRGQNAMNATRAPACNFFEGVVMKRADSIYPRST